MIAYYFQMTRLALLRAQALSDTELDEMQAAAATQAALRINAKDADGWSNLGVLHAQTGQASAARSDFEHALAIDPQHAQARANLQRLNSENSKR